MDGSLNDRVHKVHKFPKFPSYMDVWRIFGILMNNADETNGLTDYS